MRAINLSDGLKRDAQVGLESKALPTPVTYVLPDGARPTNIRLIKGTSETALTALVSRAGGLDQVAGMLVGGDPEIDLNVTGKMVYDSQRVYLQANGELSFSVRLIEISYAPDGTEKERMAFVKTEANIAAEAPLKWTGRLFPKAAAIKKFAFSRKYQIVHVNGLTYDFLYQMAKELHEKESLLLLGGGAKGTEPLILTRGARPYRGFLEGRIDGDNYCLILHLTNLELKAINEPQPAINKPQ